MTKLYRPAIAAWMLVATALLAAADASGQQIITTAIGRGELVATTYDPLTDGIYYATDRPGAIYWLAADAAPVLVAGVAGGSTADGVPALQAAVFPARNGLAVDKSGNLYFSEPSLHRVRQISHQTGLVTTIAGTGRSNFVDPRQVNGGAAVFTDLPAPGALAFNPLTGDLYIADEAWDIVYEMVAGGSPIAGSSALVRAVGGNPSNSSIFVNAQFFNPFGYAGDGGPAIDAKLNHPRGIAFDATGNLYIADTGNCVIRRVDGNLVITTFAGNSVPGFNGDAQPALDAQLFMPSGVAVDANGNLLIADTANHRVRTVDVASSTISTLAGTGTAGHAGDGSAASAATLAYPTGVSVDRTGQVLIVDSLNARLRGVGFAQTISTLVQTGSDYSGNGWPAGDAVNRPLSVAFDSRGNMYFSDSGNARVQRMDAATGTVTTFAGSGIPGYDGDGDLAERARLNCPAGLAFGPTGELYIADPCAHVVRRVDTVDDDGLIENIISTEAGNGIGSNGPTGQLATSVSLYRPFSLAFANGLLYIGEPDLANVLTVDASGTLGAAFAGVDSRGLTADSQGHVFIADDFEGNEIDCGGQSIAAGSQFGDGFIQWSALSMDGIVRLFVSEDGSTQSVFEVMRPGGSVLCGGTGRPAVSLLAGDGTGAIGYSGDGGPATSARLHHPAGTGFDGHSAIYIADTGNNVIRRLVQPVVGVVTDVNALDFGTTGLGTPTPSQFVTVKSIGSTQATFGSAALVGANTGDFTIKSDGCRNVTLSSGQTCQIAVAFQATATGARGATLQINDNAPDTPQLVTLGGVGATIAVTPAPISFGSQPQGIASAPLTVTVTNTASSGVTGFSLSFSGVDPGDFSVTNDNCTGATLGPLGACTFGVVLTPQGLGPRSAVLNVTSSAGDSPRAVMVTGTGTAVVPGAQIDPGALFFPATPTGSSTSAATVTVTSNGAAPLVVSSISVSGNQPGEFAIRGDTCSGATLAPGQTCTVQVAFAPHQICFSTATLAIVDNASGSPQTSLLSGSGTNGGGGPFQPTLFCTSHAAQPQEIVAGTDGAVWFDETGSVFSPPAIGRVTMSGGVIETPSALIPGYKPFALTFSPNGSHALVEAAGLGFQSYLDLISNTGFELQAPITFGGALMAGPDGGFWLAQQFTCGDNDWPLVTDYAPNGKTHAYTPKSVWIAANTSNHFCLHTSSIATGADGSIWVGITAGGVGITLPSPTGYMRLSRDGEFVDFTPTTGGAPNAATIGPDGLLYALMGDNTGGGCSVSRFSSGVGGVNQSPLLLDPTFAIGCNAIVAGPDNRLWMNGSHFNGSTIDSGLVAYDPFSNALTMYPIPSLVGITGYLTAGPDEGIWFRAVPSAVGRFDIGGGPSRAFVNPKQLAFGSTPIGLPSATQQVTVQSTGTSPLTMGTVTLAGADATQFVIINGCQNAVLPPGSACAITVAHKPTAVGSHTATLVINDDDAFSPQVVHLEEFTVPPQPTLSRTHVSFPTTKVGQHSALATITLNNPSDRNIAVQSVAKNGTGQDFVIQSDSCSNTTLAANSSCAVTLWFAPTAAGARSASLTFNDAANPPTQIVTLSGTGDASSGGGGCACSTTGSFVDPAVAEPVAPVSPSGSFLVTATPDGTLVGGVSDLTVTNASGTVVMTFHVPHDATWPPLTPGWGFSPDDSRFAVHYQSAGEDVIKLFDLTSASPSTPVWTSPGLLIASPTASATPSGSFGFSPFGKYLVVTQMHTDEAPVATQTMYLYIVSSSGVPVRGGALTSWIMATPPADQKDENDFVESAHWGFAPDEESFVLIRNLVGSAGPQLSLYALPSGVDVHDHSFNSAVASFVQFSLCGDALGIAQNDGSQETITIYSTNPADGVGALGSINSPTIGDTTMSAGPAQFVAEVNGNSYNVAPNKGAAGCAASTTTGTGGGSGGTTTVSVQFTAANPPLSVFQGEEYAYTFEASGKPDAKFALDIDAPAWLTIDEDSGEISVTPPLDTTDFIYSVIASNGTPSPATAGPFHVTVKPAPPPGGGQGGPFVPEEESAALATAGATTLTQAAAPVQPSSVLLLPNARGSISLPPDVTPAVSIFTYTEMDAPPAPIGALVYAGLDFTLGAVDSVSGAAVTAFADAPLATIAFTDAQLRSARITDLSRLTLFWWSGSAWVNQFPCGGCATDPVGHTLTVALSRIGEYILAATPPPPPALTIVPASIQTTAGVAFAGTIASFTSADPLDQLNQFSATVDWGDGQASPVEIARSGGGFAIKGTHTWTAPAAYQIGIAVLDGGQTVSAQAHAVVTPVQQAPQFTAATPPLTATQGTPYSYAFAASGVPAATFALSNAPAWLTIGASSGTVSGTPPSGTTSFTYSVVATNGVSPDATAGPFAVSVAPLPVPPQFTAATPPLTATQGVQYSYTFAASGVPASAFALAAGAPSWLTIGASSGVVSGTPPAGTTSFTYTVVASNGVSPNATAGPFIVTVASTTSSADLAIAITGPATASRGSSMTYTIVVSNNGPSTAFNGKVQLLVGPGVFLVSTSRPVLIFGLGYWTWSVPTLNAGQSVTFTVTLKSALPGTVFALGSVDSTTSDPKPANNIALAVTKVK